MKTKPKMINLLASVATACALVSSARAGIYTWSAPAAITSANATLNQSGTIVGAEVFGSFPEVVVLSNGATVNFAADGSVAAVTAGGNGFANGAWTNTTGNANFDTVLTQFNFDGGPKTISLNNLIAGQQYAVQLFALDERGGDASARTASFQDPADNTDVSAAFPMGANDYVIGTFTAPSSSVSIQENLADGNNGNINALVIYALGTNIPPQIASEPQPATLYHGLTATFSAVSSGTGPLSYQWQKSNVGGTVFTNLTNLGAIFGATSNTLTITNLTIGNIGDYQVVVSSAYGSVTNSPAATLTVLAGTPQFAWSAPAPITTADANLGQSGTVVGAEVFGNTEYIVTLTNDSTIDFKADDSVAAVTQGGFGTATGALGGTTGNANFDAVLNQFTWDGGPHVLTLYNLVVGQQYSVQLFALDDRGGLSSPATASYQDPNDPADLSTTFAMGNNVYIMGTFTASNSTVSVQENLLDYDQSGNINALVVRALGVIVPPQIVTAPQSVTIDQNVGTPVSLMGAASGTAPLTYVWKRGPVGSGVFTNVPANPRYAGLSGPDLIISNAVVTDTADYELVAANAVGSATSAPPATLTVQAVTPQFAFSIPAAITTADAALNQTGTIVGAEVFGPLPEIVVLTNGTSVDFKDIGATATAAGGGEFTGAYSGNTANPSFNAVLNQASYEIYGDSTKTITLQNLVPGQQYAAQLFALDDRSGSASRTVNFQDPNDSFDYSPTFAMPNNVFTIATFTAGGTTVNLQENLFGSGGNINAIVVRQLSGLPLPPQITTEPAPVNVPAGATAQFTVGANGTSLKYQWQRAVVGGSAFSNVVDANASGATTAQLTITNAGTANMADYRAIVSNGSGSVTSSPAATLNVASPGLTLLHRWSFNETGGTIAHDSIGAANGTLMGSAAFTGGGYVSLQNPGSTPQTGNSYVAIPGGLLNTLSAVTVECWVTNNGWNNGNTLVGFCGPVDGNGFGTNYIDFYSRMYSSISAFEISTIAGDSGLEALGTRCNDNGVARGTPTHYVYVYDPTVSHSITLYTNGVLSGSQSGVSIPLSSLGTAVGTIGLGVYNDSQSYVLPQNGGNKDNDAYLNGGISEVRIYNGVMNSNEVAADFQLGPDQVPPATLLHRWSFNETSGTVAHDSIGGANGTLMGSAAFTGGGYVSLQNPGSTPQTGNSYVAIPGGLLNSLAAVTVECWVTNNGWNNGNTLVGFSGPIDGNGFGTNYIDFYARMFSSISAFEISTIAGDSGLEALGTRCNDNGVARGTPTHYVYVYDPAVSHSITLYTNGVLSGSQSGVSIPLSSLGTAVGTIGLGVYNDSQSYVLPQNGGNKDNDAYLNGGVSEVRIYGGVLTSNQISADFQLGPDQLLAPATTNPPPVGFSAGRGFATLSWPESSGSFFVESSPVLGPNAVWTMVNGMQSVVGLNYQMTIPTTNGATMFFRLAQ